MKSLFLNSLSKRQPSAARRSNLTLRSSRPQRLQLSSKESSNATVEHGSGKATTRTMMTGRMLGTLVPLLFVASTTKFLKTSKTSSCLRASSKDQACSIRRPSSSASKLTRCRSAIVKPWSRLASKRRRKLHPKKRRLMILMSLARSRTTSASSSCNTVPIRKYGTSCRKIPTTGYHTCCARTLTPTRRTSIRESAILSS